MMRIMRLLRLYRLWRHVVALISSKEIMEELSEQLSKFAVLQNFITAHVQSQQAFVKSFCVQGQVKLPEVARIIMQSQVSVCKALELLLKLDRQMDSEITAQVLEAEQTIRVALH